MKSKYILPVALLALTLCSLARAAEPVPPNNNQKSTIENPPSPTLADDLKTIQIPLLPSYASAKHPRLLFSTDDKAALQQKAKANPEFWKPVLASAKRLASVPDAATIKSGAKIWRIEEVESGALAYFVTGDKVHLDQTLAWMIPHCQEKIWGTGYRDNLDLQASWYLYHLSVAYDILHDDIPDADRKIIVAGLSSHAKALFDSFDPNTHDAQNEKYNFDQNHTYIPAVALAAASLTLMGEVPEAKAWLTRAYAMMQRCRYVMGDDGYYYEGYGYWSYAMHWHVRYADMISRATGENFLDLPAFKKNWLFALQLSLPGNPGAFDIHDTNRWTGDVRPDVAPNNFAILWDLATAAQKEGDPSAGDDRTTADFYNARAKTQDYPAAAFLWYSPQVPPTPLNKITPYHYFNDHDVITWRSGWDKDATCLLFRCGPPEGHAADAKLKQMQDWTINAGHVHPDIGAFYLYAKGQYLAVSTGYTAEKWTKDHNTLLVDDKGQGDDGSYWDDRGIPYDTFNDCRITSHYLSDNYAFASGQFGAAYTHGPNIVHLQRSLLATKRYLLVIDDMHSESGHKLTWLLHTDAPFTAGPDSKSFIAKLPHASLALIPFNAPEVTISTAKAVVQAGTAPGKATPTQRGYQLALTMKAPANPARLINLLVPLDANEIPPAVTSVKLEADTISFILEWPNQKPESISLNLKWQSPQATQLPTPGPGPATITSK